MSGLVRGIKKVFKKITNFVKKYWKYIVIAVAVYFTAGVALSYFGGTASFASAMPGFGTGGLFSKAAVAMGFQGSAGVASGLSMTSGAWAGAAGAAYGSTLTAAEIAAAQTGLGVGTAGVGSTTASVAGGAGTAQPVVGVAGTDIGIGAGSGASAGTANMSTALGTAGGKAAATTGATTGAMSATDAAMKAMSGAMKMQAASTLLQTAGGLLADDPYKEQHKLQWGQAFGVDRSGNRQFGWSTGESPAAGPNQASPYAQQPAYSTQGSGGSMFAAQGGGQEFIASPQQAAAQAAPQGDFIVQPKPAGG